MNTQYEQQLNHFFVHAFNKINIWENQAISRTGAKDLSVKELHVIATASELAPTGQNTMTAIADSLAIRGSSLTTSVNTLVRKGYLAREADEKDRRIIRIVLTAKGEEANRLHSAFHARMIRSVASQFSESELAILTQSLSQVNVFLKGMIEMGGNEDANA